MEITITTAAIATLISALTSTSVTLWITSLNKKKNIEDQLDSILKIAIQYPYLENEKFTETWNPNFDPSNEMLLRYDVYCTLLFNYLSRVATHHNYDKNKIENFIAIKDWVRLHAKYWHNPTSTYENLDSYDKKFSKLINEYLK